MFFTLSPWMGCKEPGTPEITHRLLDACPCLWGRGPSCRLVSELSVSPEHIKKHRFGVIIKASFPSYCSLPSFITVLLASFSVVSFYASEL